MPTGYTYGIKKGTITTFKQFAEQCSRAFLIHMRDDAMDTPYYPREVGSYYADSIKETKEKLAALNAMSDEDLYNEVLQEQKEEIARIKIVLAENADFKTKLEKMLVAAENYTAPTEKHTGIREFMIEQLKITIEQDCKASYYKDRLKLLQKTDIIFDAKAARAKKIIKYNDAIAYAERNHAEEIKRVKDHNKWYIDFINSIDNEGTK